MFFPFRCYGSMPVFIAIAPGLSWSLVLCHRSFREMFIPLSEASLRALLLLVRFLVVLHAAASLRVFWPLSWLLPFQGSAPVSRLFLSWRTPLSRSHFPSLAPSSWSPSPLREWALLPLSCYVLGVPSASSSHRSHLSISPTCLSFRWRLQSSVTLHTCSFCVRSL